MEETEVIELKGVPLSPWRQKRIRDRADRLYDYLDDYEGEKLTQNELCEALGLGIDGHHLREAALNLEERGWLMVDRNRKPHAYTLNRTRRNT
ncbi:hypothetical protein ABZX85_09740 [Streptomyces sp. NPDC004539]|uniref:hypothetical protein n=1 Tax=Streptomyces sp. NPDC004539 TaxID=3154280 RepID=UPI0033A2093A